MPQTIHTLLTQHFKQWVASYPFYSNVQKEGVVLYEAA